MLKPVCTCLLAFRHLLAIGSENEAIADEIFERRLIEKRRREYEQRVEPAARLIDALG